MKGWAIYTNLPEHVIVRLPHPRSRDSQGEQTFLAPSSVKKTHNYDTQCCNHHPSLSTPSPNGLNLSKMKWWAIYTSLPLDVIVRLPHPRSRYSQGQETFLAPSFNKEICNYHAQCLNHHRYLSTLRPNGLSRSKMKWWAIYKNLTADDIMRVAHPRRRDSKGSERFLAPSADKQTRNYATEWSNHHPSLSTPKPKRLIHSKVIWWTIYTNIPVDVIVRLPHPRSRDSQGQGTFLTPSAEKQIRNYYRECSNHHPFLSTPRRKG